jgi:hypothetical protein
MNPFPGSTRYAIAAALAIFILLAGIPFAMAADDTGNITGIGATIIARSYPPGAAIYLNDEYRGVTPSILRNITPGEYVVNLTLAGYNNESWTTSVFDGSTRDLGANLEPASAVPAPTGSGSIAIDSDPGGASVTLDGNPAGTTPAGRAALILNNVPAGSHTVTVEVAGYPPHTEAVTVIRNQVVKVNADFITQSPTTPGTPVATSPGATTGSQKPVPLSPLAAVAAAGLAGLVFVLRRS